MPDRVEELRRKARSDLDGAAIVGMVPDHAYRTLTELATIAREADQLRKERDAETRAAKWLAGELYDYDWQDIGTRAARRSENEPYTESDKQFDIDSIIAAAREAVRDE